MAFFQGHSYRRVAETLDLPEGTVKSRIRRGLSRLQALLGEEALALA
ncbi:MAG: sigma factor-like helix-turn-helix DNA-binding protein [Acidimicrobiia bacterium]